MKDNKTTFLQTTFIIGDDETATYYILIIEIVDGVPTNRTLITTFPKTPWQFTRYPYGIN
jgi:hypothetical protein